MFVPIHAAQGNDVLTASRSGLSCESFMSPPTPPAVANLLLSLVMGPHPHLSSRHSTIAMRWSIVQAGSSIYWQHMISGARDKHSIGWSKAFRNQVSRTSSNIFLGGQRCYFGFFHPICIYPSGGGLVCVLSCSPYRRIEFLETGFVIWVLVRFAYIRFAGWKSCSSFFAKSNLNCTHSITQSLAQKYYVHNLLNLIFLIFYSEHHPKHPSNAFPEISNHHTAQFALHKSSPPTRPRADTHASPNHTVRYLICTKGGRKGEKGEKKEK